MIFHRRTPALWVFGVDADAVQLTWRLLRPGSVHLRVQGTEVAADLEVTEAPGAITLTGLPSGRLLTIEATGTALGEPRTLLARTLPALGGQELCRIATLSDLHLGIHGFGHRGTIRELPHHPHPHALRCAEAAVAEASAWGAQRLVVKGDLTNSGLPHQWRAYAGLAHAAPMPVDAIAGNHDHGYGRRTASITPAEASAAFHLSIAQPVAVRDLPGIRLVLADTTVPGANHGSIRAVAPTVIEAAADAPRSGGVLVMLHHQLQPHRVAEGWPLGIDHGDGLRLLDDLGRAHPHVLVTSGHTHRHRRWGRAGVVVTQVGSTKDYPGVWAGYVVHEGGMRQIARRVQDPGCLSWTDHSRTAAFGLWEHVATGRLDARCFNVAWGAPPSPLAYP